MTSVQHRIDLPLLGVGTSALAGMPAAYGYDVSGQQALSTLERVLTSPIRFIDTSNEYGGGTAEERIGAALRGFPKLPDLVLATKADPVPGARSFDGERVRASFRESASRLGRDRFPLFHLHDPERFDFAHMTAPGGAVDAMVELRDSGQVGAIGVAGGEIDAMARYIDLGIFDVVLNHNQYNLLDRRGERLLEHALAAGVHFINAAPYASGILAKPRSASPRYQYREPSGEIVETVNWLHETCANFDLPLAALALQFSTKDSRISSTVVGVSSPARVDQLTENAETPIPAGLWEIVSARLEVAIPGAVVSEQPRLSDTKASATAQDGGRDPEAVPRR